MTQADQPRAGQDPLSADPPATPEPQGRPIRSQTSMFVSNPGLWQPGITTNWFLDEPVTTQVVEPGIVLPMRPRAGTNHYEGGVCTGDGAFLAGHTRHRVKSAVHGFSCSWSYPVPADIAFVDETVIFGGVLYNHFGHTMAESLGRIWWCVEHMDNDSKVVFVTNRDRLHYPDFLVMAGIDKERLMVINEPTRFASIIVPDPSYYFREGYTDKAMVVYDAIRDAVAPADYKKVYLTRTQLPQDNLVGEQYFEDYYRSRGYEVIAPERLTIPQQIAVISGAREIACVSGTLPHFVLFAHEGVELTILSREEGPNTSQPWMNQARQVQCTVVDVNMTFLPSFARPTSFLIAQTPQWEQYRLAVGDAGEQPSVNPEDILAYLEKWTKNALTHSPESLASYLNGFTMADLLIALSRSLMHQELSETERRDLIAAFPSPKQLQATLAAALG